MSKYEVKRTALRERLFPGELAYEPPEKGFMKATRTLPLVLGLLGSKQISEDKDPSRVYLELHVKVREDWRDDERLLNEMGLGRR